MQKTNSLKFFSGLVSVALIFVLAGCTDETVENTGKVGGQMKVQDSGVRVTYLDGVYESKGSYLSPGGNESIDVKMTLKSGVIESVEVKPNATNPKSITFQDLFIGGVEGVVVGKRIDQLKLDVVSGSSLTPKGFNDALEKIKVMAKS